MGEPTVMRPTCVVASRPPSGHSAAAKPVLLPPRPRSPPIPFLFVNCEALARVQLDLFCSTESDAGSGCVCDVALALFSRVTGLNLTSILLASPRRTRRGCFRIEITSARHSSEFRCLAARCLHSTTGEGTVVSSTTRIILSSSRSFICEVLMRQQWMRDRIGS